jgi:hypothetical protein
VILTISSSAVPLPSGSLPLLRFWSRAGPRFDAGTPACLRPPASNANSVTSNMQRIYVREPPSLVRRCILSLCYFVAHPGKIGLRQDRREAPFRHFSQRKGTLGEKKERARRLHANTHRAEGKEKQKNFS